MDKKTIAQTVEISAKTALSVIPVGGPLLTEIWNSIKENTAERRLQDWQNKIEQRVSTLEMTLDDIGNNEAFTTAILNTTEMALKVSEDKKREYLANAVINSISTDLDENILLIFIDLIGKYTVWHLQILEYFMNPMAKGVSSDKYYMGSPKTPLYDVYPKFKQHDALIDKIIKDLYLDGMLGTDSLNVSMTSDGMIASRTTDLGNQFIRFISYDSINH